MADKRITMLQSRHGSRNGLDLEYFVEGQTYIVPSGLAEVFERFKHARIEGDAEEAAPQAPPPPIAEAAAPAEAPAAAAPEESKPKAARKPRNLSGKMDRSLSSED